MIIISRRVYRFYNPNQPLVSNAERTDAEGNRIVYQELAIPAGDGRNTHFKDLIFDTVPGDPQQAPDWIKADTPDKMNITTFNRAVAAGMLTEVAYVSDEFAAARAAAEAPKPLSEAPLPLRSGQPRARRAEQITVGKLAAPVIDSSTPLSEPEPATPARPLAGGRAKRAS